MTEKESLQTLVDVGFTVADIALRNKWSVSKTRYWLKKHGLQAARERGSIGHKAWRIVLKREFPAYPLREEYHIGKRLRLDFYIPALYLGFEIDGKQHTERTDFWDFHPDYDKFIKQQHRSEDKESICKVNGILLVRIQDRLAVKAALEPAAAEWLMGDIWKRVAEHEPPDTGKAQHSPRKYSDYQQRMLDMGREHRKKQYRKAKALKDKLNGKN